MLINKKMYKHLQKMFGEIDINVGDFGLIMTNMHIYMKTTKTMSSERA